MQNKNLKKTNLRLFFGLITGATAGMKEERPIDRQQRTESNLAIFTHS